MTIAAWEAALTRMEDELDAQEEALRTGQLTEVAAFEPPDSLGPLPAQLADRVNTLIQRTGLLATFVQYQLVATDADLRYERRETKHAGAQALYLDRTF
ncbi:hypothetical protein SAMN05421595_0225 [Austwickia chelonae]|uniref:Uncharacterized protein n=1 Tax=Austwickia chelonae NBRC 105200 TaxID=1184607 RepID=K6WC86_9MICO|nr:hypothetical protein [Austwickia chelonae]GAB79462.1 hypothetical protein AUCHE_26_00130 [Austwickia chelonae NBRC 105200]SEV88263.1 hypothetical protein SAMN05421595_0225 [Austwickia chelonae]